jgi:hypothetical protein
MTDELNKKDSLKELEKLLESDVLKADDEDRLISQKEWTSIIIRLSVFLIFVLTLYFTGILDNLLIVLVATGILIVVEGINVLKMVKSKKNKPQFKL